MSKIISYEDLCSIERISGFKNDEISKIEILKEASENGCCDILLDNDSSNPPVVDIIYKIEGLKNAIGLYICVREWGIDVYSAINFGETISSNIQIWDFNNLEVSLNEVVAKSIEQMNICPKCNKEVPFDEQERYSFAGRCCKECLPKMKAKYEYNGWYN